MPFLDKLLETINALATGVLIADVLAILVLGSFYYFGG